MLNGLTTTYFWVPQLLQGKRFSSKIQSFEWMISMAATLANLFIEAAVVGIVCIVFLILFVVAGIRQILKDRE